MFGRRKRRLSDYSSEIQSHIELAADQLREEGFGEREAHYAARRQFGNVTAAEERFYDAGCWRWLDALGRDLRYACRMIRREPGSTLAVILTLALALGVTTAIFSLVNALLFTHLPYRDPARLVVLGRAGSFVSILRQSQAEPEAKEPGGKQMFAIRQRLRPRARPRSRFSPT